MEGWVLDVILGDMETVGDDDICIDGLGESIRDGFRL